MFALIKSEVFMAKTNYTFGNPQDSPEFLLWQVTNLWQKGKSIVLEKYNLTNPQITLLASILWLKQQKTEITQIILSSHSNIDPMTTSTVLRTLQSKGLVIRAEHSTDTRAKIVALSNEGRKLTIQALKSVETFNKNFFNPLGKKANEFNQILMHLLSENKLD